MGRMIVLDPTGRARQTGHELSPRLPDLGRGIIGLLDNGKANAGIFLNALAAILQARGLRTHQVRKAARPGPIGPAPESLLADLKERCFAVVNAFGD